MWQEKQWGGVFGKYLVKGTFDRLGQMCPTLPNEVTTGPFKSKWEKTDVEDKHTLLWDVGNGNIKVIHTTMH